MVTSVVQFVFWCGRLGGALNTIKSSSVEGVESIRQCAALDMRE
jgi:hypothetical protein